MARVLPVGTLEERGSSIFAGRELHEIRHCYHGVSVEVGAGVRAGPGY